MRMTASWLAVPTGPAGYKAVARCSAPAGKLRLGRDDTLEDGYENEHGIADFELDNWIPIQGGLSSRRSAAPVAASAPKYISAAMPSAFRSAPC